MYERNTFFKKQFHTIELEAVHFLTPWKNKIPPLFYIYFRYA